VQSWRQGDDLPPPPAQGMCGGRHELLFWRRLRWGRSTDADGVGDVRQLPTRIPCTPDLTGSPS
jgi:hypothetical protein